ncbi:Heterogeneous nuclear ribonucleoprotein 27C [Nymphon striatum]|nr:Heterogeneous nuclear ribonucleoprotein 27C [Nymphon striatum]
MQIWDLGTFSTDIYPVDFSKLFVGGLSWETSKESLSNYFGVFGEVVDCVVMRNNETNKSRGFGFVTFKDPSRVDEVLLKETHTLDNRTIDPKACNPRSMQQKKKGNNFKVFLGGLPNNVTESDLQSFYSNYGNVTEVVIMYDQEKKKCRGFGFLSFDSEEAVKRACADHFVHIKGKQVPLQNQQVECKLAQSRVGGTGSTGSGGTMNGTTGMGSTSGSWNQMPNNMGGPQNGAFQGGWGNQQGGGYQGNFNQQGQGFQNWNQPAGGYGNQPPYGGQQGYSNYGNYGGGNVGGGGNYGFGNYGMQQGPGNGPQGGPGGYGAPMSGGPQNMGPNQMGGPGMKPDSTSGYGNNYGNMGNYSHEASNYGPSRGFGGGPMGPCGMQNSGFMPQGYNAPSGGSTGNVGPNVGNQDGPPGGRGGAQQSAGYHPYRR